MRANHGGRQEHKSKGVEGWCNILVIMRDQGKFWKVDDLATQNQHKESYFITNGFCPINFVCCDMDEWSG